MIFIQSQFEMNISALLSVPSKIPALLLAPAANFVPGLTRPYFLLWHIQILLLQTGREQLNHA